jgi:nuclear transport factor 2 (NTF2) superfamily protein
MLEQILTPAPPFTHEQAILKIRMAENAWNSRDPHKVSLAYTPDSIWRNRSEFITGRAAIVEFLTLKWKREQDYRLIKELWAYGENRIAVRFAYEWTDGSQWFRSYGNENWEFAADGRMAVRHASINDITIKESERKFLWPRTEPDMRPEGHASLSELGL